MSVVYAGANPDVRVCERHSWGGEILHTFIASGEVVSARTCKMCGVVRIHRQKPRFVVSKGDRL
jgi:hypothetical protein